MNWNDGSEDYNKIRRLRAEVERLQQETAQLRGALSALQAERQWQPIETAPKDGTTILAWVQEWRRPVTITWHTYSMCWWEVGDGSLVLSPTHWMPLPAPPSSDQETPR